MKGMTMTQDNPLRSTIARSLSRRRLLQVAGIGGAATVAAACGVSPTGSGSASGTPSAATQEDRSEQDKSVNWSTWAVSSRLATTALEGKHRTFSSRST